MQTPAPPSEISWSLLWGVAVAVLAFALNYLHLYFVERNRKLYAPLHPLYDEKGNPCWASLNDLNKLGAKLSSVQEAVTHVDERVDGIDREMGLVRQAQMFTHQEMMDKLGTAVSQLDHVVKEVKEISGNQRAQAEQLNIILSRKDRA